MGVTTFRSLLVVYAAVTILGWSLPYAPVPLTAEMHDVLSRSGTGSATWLTNSGLYWGSLGANLAAVLGMFIFRSWGRSLAVILVVLNILLVLFGGVTVSAPFDGFVNSIAGTLNIVLLTVAFLPPVAVRFRETPVAGSVDASSDATGENAYPVPEPTGELVEILATGDEGLLAVLESVFREHSIDFAVSGDQVQDLFAAGRLGGYNFALGPARVFVAAGDASRARQLIQELGENASAETEKR